MRRWLAVVLALVLGLVSSGCVLHPHPYYHTRSVRHSTRADLQFGHVHTAYCGHTRYGATYVRTYHQHGSHCGHVFRGGIWIRVR